MTDPTPNLRKHEPIKPLEATPAGATLLITTLWLAPFIIALIVLGALKGM